MNFCKFALVAALSVAGGTMGLTTDANAGPITVLDEYIGADPTSNAYDGKDVIGDTNVFDIDSVTFGVVDNKDLQVRVNTVYAGQEGFLGTQYGALFIGTDITKYNPTPPADGSQDTFVGDEDRFNLAYTLEAGGVLGVKALNGLSGAASDVELSTPNPPGPGGNDNYIYRADQAWKPKTIDSSGADVGTHTIDATNDYIEFYIKDFFGAGKPGGASVVGTQLVFGWAMSCANDIIVDTVTFTGDIGPIPLPPGLVLLLSGLMGLGWLGRARARHV